jgi:hypothetical protein
MEKEVRVVTLKDMLDLPDKVCKVLLSHAVNEGVTAIPLTAARLQALYLHEGRTAWALAKKYQLSFEVARHAMQVSGAEGAFITFTEGSSTTYVRTVLDNRGTECVKNISTLCEDGTELEICWDYVRELYVKRRGSPTKPYVSPEDEHIFKGIASRYNLQLKGKFCTKVGRCPTCQKKL